MKNQIAILLVAIVSAGCSSMNIEDYSETTPEFILEDYFEGRTLAWGLFEDRFGNVQRQFTVTIDGSWDGKKLVLNEDFIYSDGETENRLWTLTKSDDLTYTGTADNVIGVATGTRAGNAFNWRYDFNMKVGDGYWKVKFDDWMFLQPNGVMLNKATISRWGFKLGTLYLSFSKPEVASAATPTSDPELSLAASR